MNANQTLVAAISAGYDKLSTRDLLLCILYGAVAGGGGGGGTGAVYSTDDASPVIAAITPTTASIWYQTPSKGTGTNLWSWDLDTSTWNQISA